MSDPLAQFRLHIPVMRDAELLELRSLVLREVHNRERKQNILQAEQRVRSIADRVI